MQLRPYQQQVIEAMRQHDTGTHLCVLPTGGGKTICFTEYLNNSPDRALIVSHRSELVRQPLKYLTCSYAIEQGNERSTHNEKVTSTTVQTMSKRLNNFSTNEYPTIIIDEAHHATASTYRAILDYFDYKRAFLFTATPNRADQIGLKAVCDDIIFQTDLLWMIQNGYLCNIECRRVHLGFDLSSVKTVNGDFCLHELDEAMKGTEPGIVEAYREFAKGQTVIFCQSVRQAQEVKNIIGEEAFIVTGTTPKQEREKLLKAYERGEYKTFVNVMVASEGYDNPAIETVILAAPTKSQTKYLQAAGRGMRLHPDKEKMLLIDICGASNNGMLTAPSLLGYDIEQVPKSKLKKVEGDLFELEEKIMKLSDTPAAWIKSHYIVQLFAKQQKLNLRDLNLRRLPSGEMVITAAPKQKYKIPAIDQLGNVDMPGVGTISAQAAIDLLFEHLKRNHAESRALWSKRNAKWLSNPASAKQMELINKWAKSGKLDFSDVDIGRLTCGEASAIIDSVFGG